MSDDPKTTVFGEVLGFGKKLLGSQALSTLLLMGLAVGGYRALAAEARDGGAAAAAPVAAELNLVKADLERTKAAQLEQGKDSAEVKRRLERVELLGTITDANMRLVMQRLGVQPVTPLEPKDGGR